MDKSAIDLEVLRAFPALTRLVQGMPALRLTVDEQDMFLNGLHSALQFQEAARRDVLLRCLDVGVASLHRRRELAQEISRAGTSKQDMNRNTSD